MGLQHTVVMTHLSKDFLDAILPPPEIAFELKFSFAFIVKGFSDDS